MARSACCLCDFAFVMREFEVHATSMNVELLAKIFGAHDRALDMPSRDTIAPGRWPPHNVRWRGLFPEGKVDLIPLFVLAFQFPSTLHEFFDIAAGENSVVMFAVVFGDIEIHRSIHYVSISFVEQRLDQLDLLNDMSGSCGFDVGGEDIELSHDLVKALGVLVHDFHGLEFFQARAFRNLILALVGVVLEVTDVGNVSDVANLVSEEAKVAGNHVKGEKCSDVSQVDVVIDGWSADIDSYVSRGDGLEGFFSSLERVSDGNGILL